VYIVAVIAPRNDNPEAVALLDKSSIDSDLL
jgi:hypothetical protein